jgi:hypothetical protein
MTHWVSLHTTGNAPPALADDDSMKWEHYCPQGWRPAHADGALWMDGGLFVTSQGSAWRFDPSTPTCD